MNNISEKMYRINSKIHISNSNNGILKLSHLENDWEMSISEAILDIINLFNIPSTIPTALVRIEDKFNIDGSPTIIINKLIEESILVTSVLSSLEKENVEIGGMFQSPYLTFSQSLKSGADIMFFGVPYDVSVTNKPGCRFGADYIRKCSTALLSYREVDGIPTGVWDPRINRRVLDGIRMVDCGNVFSGVFTRNDEHYCNIKNIMKLTAESQIFPVMIGGDHSITLPAVLGMIEHYPKIGVIQFDAHNDYSGRPEGEYKEYACHSNFMNWLVHNDSVSDVLQIGIRQLEQKNAISNKITTLTLPYNKADFISSIEKLDKTVPYYLTFDVDCFDTSLIRSTGTPLPGGYNYEEVLEMIELICNEIELIGLDVVELIPSVDDVEGILFSDIIYRLISAKNFKKNKF